MAAVVARILDKIVTYNWVSGKGLSLKLSGI
jgi:hypothetical protein